MGATNWGFAVWVHNDYGAQEENNTPVTATPAVNSAPSLGLSATTGITATVSNVSAPTQVEPPYDKYSEFSYDTVIFRDYGNTAVRDIEDLNITITMKKKLRQQVNSYVWSHLLQRLGMSMHEVYVAADVKAVFLPNSWYPPPKSTPQAVQPPPPPVQTPPAPTPPPVPQVIEQAVEEAPVIASQDDGEVMAAGIGGNVDDEQFADGFLKHFGYGSLHNSHSFSHVAGSFVGAIVVGGIVALGVTYTAAVVVGIAVGLGVSAPVAAGVVTGIIIVAAVAGIAYYGYNTYNNWGNMNGYQRLESVTDFIGSMIGGWSAGQYVTPKSFNFNIPGLRTAPSYGGGGGGGGRAGGPAAATLAENWIITWESVLVATNVLTFPANLSSILSPMFSNGGLPNGVNTIDELTNEISNGHAYNKHVIEQGEFPEISSRAEFKGVIKHAIEYATHKKALVGGRYAWWDDVNKVVVIYNPNAVDSGTAFRPSSGKLYFENLH